jgi:hypothetical protein
MHGAVNDRPPEIFATDVPCLVRICRGLSVGETKDARCGCRKSIWTKGAVVVSSARWKGVEKLLAAAMQI